MANQYSYPTDYLFRERIKYEERVHSWMRGNLSCDLPTFRAICREYYGKDPFLDVVFLGPEPYLWDNILARFMHDPMKKPNLDYEIVNWGDEIVIRQDERLLPLRVAVSPALLKAIYRVLYEP